MLRVSVLMFLVPTLANVYQATWATGKANVKVRFQNLVNTKYIQMSMYVTQMRPLHYFHFLRAHTTANRQPRLKMRVNTCVIVLRSPQMAVNIKDF